MKEKFKKSDCKCDWCEKTHKLNLIFDHHKPINFLQKRMKNIIKKLEKKYK
jgi:hypothetical protein